MIAGIYARESSDDKVKTPPIENQIEICTTWSKENSHNDLFTYQDKGYSGGTWTRPGLNKMINDIKANRFKLLIIFNTDRLARDTELFLWIWRKLLKKKIRVYSITQGWVDMETSGGRFSNTVIAASNELYRMTISDKVKKAYEHKIKKGENNWGRPRSLTDEDIKAIGVLRDKPPSVIRRELGLNCCVQTVRRVVKSLG